MQQDPESKTKSVITEAENAVREVCSQVSEAFPEWSQSTDCSFTNSVPKGDTVFSRSLVYLEIQTSI